MHRVRVRKLALAHRVKQLPSRAENCYRRNAEANWDTIFRRQFDVLVKPADTYIYHDEVARDQPGQLRFMHLRIQRMAVRSPVGAENQHHVLPFAGSRGNSTGNELTRIRSFLKNLAAAGQCFRGVSAQRKQGPGKNASAVHGAYP